MPATSPDAPPAVQATLSFGNAMSSLTDFLFSGVLVRHPNLKLAYSEGQIGWIPYILERADDVWVEHRAWGGVRDIVPEPPSTYYYRQVYGCFFRDRHGIDSLDKVGVDRVVVDDQGSRLLPAGTEPTLAAQTELLAVDLEGRAPADALDRGAEALSRLGPTLLVLAAARLAAGDPDDLARLVPEYVSLPRGVTALTGSIEWSRDPR